MCVCFICVIDLFNCTITMAKICSCITNPLIVALGNCLYQLRHTHRHTYTQIFAHTLTGETITVTSATCRCSSYDDVDNGGGGTQAGNGFR